MDEAVKRNGNILSDQDITSIIEETESDIKID